MSFSHKLATPIERASPKDGEPKLITEVTVRKMVAGDLRVTDKHKGEVAQAFALISQLTGLDMKTLERMDVPDFEALSDILGNFSTAGKKAVEGE